MNKELFSVLGILIAIFIWVGLGLQAIVYIFNLTQPLIAGIFTVIWIAITLIGIYKIIQKLS